MLVGLAAAFWFGSCFVVVAALFVWLAVVVGCGVSFGGLFFEFLPAALCD